MCRTGMGPLTGKSPLRMAPPPYIGKVMVIVVPSFSLLLKAIVP